MPSIQNEMVREDMHDAAKMLNLLKSLSKGRRTEAAIIRENRMECGIRRNEARPETLSL